MQDGLFDNPPPPILCFHGNCRKEITYAPIGQFGDWRWIHVGSNQSQCTREGSQWAKPASNTMCSRCEKPMPQNYCWDQVRVMGQCPMGFLARDIEESPRAVRDLYNRVQVDSLGRPQSPNDVLRQQMNAELTEGPSDDVRARARTSDPITSHEAADSITSEAMRRSQLGVLAMFQRFGPMHDVALIERYMAYGEGHPVQSESGIRTRRSELVAQGVLEDSGEKVRLDSGRRAIVWKLFAP